jgi:hypothetical protein
MKKPTEQPQKTQGVTENRYSNKDTKEEHNKKY